MEQKSSGIWATTIPAVAGFLGVQIGGWLSDTISKRHLRGRTYVSAAGLVLLIPALIGIGLAPRFWIVMACAGLYGLAFGLFDTNNMPILCQMLPPRLRASGYGFLNLVGISTGAWLTPKLGDLKDHGVPLAQCFALSAGFALVAAGVMLGLRPRSLYFGHSGTR